MTDLLVLRYSDTTEPVTNAHNAERLGLRVARAYRCYQYVRAVYANVRRNRSGFVRKWRQDVAIQDSADPILRYHYACDANVSRLGLPPGGEFNP